MYYKITFDIEHCDKIDQMSDWASSNDIKITSIEGSAEKIAFYFFKVQDAFVFRAAWKELGQSNIEP